MSEQSEEKERQVVAECRHHIPAKMHKDDGEVLLIILYKIGVLTELDAAVRRAKEGNESDDEIEFSDYFDFDDDIELDSEGRITVLAIYRTAATYDVQPFYILPPIIKRLQKLKRIILGKCRLLPIELGNLPLLKSISFQCCDRALFESIPEGLVLSALKQVTISTFKRSCPSLSSLCKILPDTLEELIFEDTKREQSDEILVALQNHDFEFRDSLRRITMIMCELNEGDLERLLFDILPRFSNMHTLDLEYNPIKSLRGIEDRIKKLDRISASSSSPPSSSSKTVIPGNNNAALSKVSNNLREKVKHDPKEEAALITILDAFDGIYHICL